jgi:signal transduction histidine kinase
LSSERVDQVRTFARGLSLAVMAIAGVALLGYILGQPLLFQILPTLRGMSPLTATALVSAAAAVLASSRLRERLVRAAAAFAAILSLAALGSHALVGADNLSPAVGAALFGIPIEQVGRMSVATATSLIFLAAAAIVRRRHPFTADVSSGLGLVIAGTALLGYLYGVADLYALPMFNSMGLNTAVALTLLAVAEVLVEPQRGWASVIVSREIGGGATRRQLSFIAVPVIAGWVLLRATGAAQVGPGAAMALLVIITVVPLAMLILRDGRILNALDRAQRDREDIQARFTSGMERKLAEQATQLDHEGAVRAQAEAAMYRAQRMEAVGQLTGGIAHDFNNLLMAVRGNLELMQRKLSPEEERLHRYLENAVAATDKGAKVTAQLLAFSRSQKLQLRPVELDPVLYGARELIGSSLGPLIDIHLTLDTASAWALTDPDQLELAILNLAVNARDAMPDGGTLRIESGPCRTRLGDEADETSYISIRVIDTGAGMAEDVAAHAIEPFFTTKERDKGTGLGLAQVYGFVRQCGGDLRIISAIGAGTSVEILLRCAEPSVEALPVEASKHGTAPASARLGQEVLVVDDDDAVRAVIVDALIAAGFQVLEASSGEAGLSLLEANSPVAAVIDFLMPGMNGAEVARLAQRRRPGLPIVFVSGYSDTVALDGIMGAVVLRKPFDIGALDRALSSVLQ